MSIVFGTLCSGSSGNCAVLGTDTATVMIDAGRSAKYLTDALRSARLDPARVSGIFLTHEHTDHVSALATFTKKFPVPVHAAYGTAGCVGNKCAPGTLQAHPPVFTETVGDITVTSFTTMHDTEMSVGYRLDAAGRSFGYATDLGIFTDSVLESLSGCECVILEANHDMGMLMSGPYPPELRRRIASEHGHLSNADSARAAAMLAGRGTRRILLAHLSAENNLPSLALSSVKAGLAEAGFETVSLTSEPGPGQISLGTAMPAIPVLIRL